jgi:hypothetical protein
LKEYVDNLTIEVPSIPKDILIQQACDSYNCVAKDNRSLATPNSDADFLWRITVNYLRHEMTAYEKHLREIAGRAGIDEAYSDLKWKVLEAIAEAYPWLASECLDQQCKLDTKSLEDFPARRHA